MEIVRKIVAAKIVFKFYLLILVVFFGTDSDAQNRPIATGSAAPFFKLRNIDNNLVSFNDYPTAKGFILIFISNVCPYSKAYEQRILDLDKKYARLQFPVIALNSNDPSISPGDSFEKMRERSKSRHYTFPYLCDEQQQVADLYGAGNTPQVFIVSKRDTGYAVEYTGAIDNDTPNKNPGKIRYAEDAVDALLNNKKPVITATKAISCSITRKRKQP